MQTTAQIKLDVASTMSPPTVYAKQLDKSTRYVKATILQNGVPYTIPEGATARIRILKPDGTTVYNTATVSNNAVTAELTSQTLAVGGIATAEMGLYKDDQILSTFVFYVRIERSAISDEAIESTDEFTVLEQAIRDAGTATTSATSAASAANTAASNANAAKTAADNAASAAKTAASDANAAKTAADNAASAANSAAGVANNAASSANSAAGTANAAAQAANDAISAIYHDKNFLLTVNPDDSLTLTYNDEEE